MAKLKRNNLIKKICDNCHGNGYIRVAVGDTSIDFRDSGASMDLPVPLFTGDKAVEFDVGHGTEGLIYVKQPQALPMTILGIYPRLETENV